MSPFPYVYVNEDGSVRELTEDEREHISAKYHGADGNRPYIKGKYQQLTPDKKILGYLPRKKVPKGINISEV